MQTDLIPLLRNTVYKVLTRFPSMCIFLIVFIFFGKVVIMLTISVRDFGKIKEASIKFDDYLIFVGDNNSGKTYLMQLIYGLCESLKNIRGFQANSLKRFPFKVDSRNIGLFLKDINEWIKRKKSEIVKNIFKESLEIGSLELKLDSLDEDDFCFELKNVDKSEFTDTSILDEFKWSEGPFLCLFRNGFPIVLDDDVSIKKEMPRLWDFFAESVMDYLLHGYGDEGSLFLPVSRSGLNLVYKEILAQQAANQFLSSVQNKKRYIERLGLSKPIFDYMLFLQKYQYDSSTHQKNKLLVDFIEKKIIKGRVLHEDGNIRYITDSGVDLPLSLSSSMVHELCSLIWLLTSKNNVGMIFYDEIETSQHPSTQIQLARLLNRLVNADYKMIVSTHSDTMAAAINNMLSLPTAKNVNHVLKERRYSKQDLLLPYKTVRAYQFIIKKDRSVVKEIPKYDELGLGFDFSLFNHSNEVLADDYNAIHRDE